MALLACLGCGTRFAVGLEACPHCGSEDFEEDGLPKITNAGVSFPEPADVPADGAEPVAADEPSPEPEPAAATPVPPRVPPRRIPPPAVPDA